ncbi:MAG TPA: tryptophan synthase subunit alpha [Candidatus Acidoferrales bacterium]|nr:tryptophan synthase subunit alpha [Candidatus Acidoferrales bacterium]
MTNSFPTPSTRISRRFEDLRRAGELGLVAYITAGDPSLDATRRIVLAAAEAGADVVELGVPFSDPLADGPVIQRASERALKSGTTLTGVFHLVRDIRLQSQVPLVLFTYFNPVLQFGIDTFATRAQSAGADGALITDLPPEDSADYRAALRSRGLDTIFLAAPTTGDERMRRIASVSSGFLYVISRTGVTGEREGLADELPALLRRARSATALPLAVGFGISLPGHVSVLGGLADAAVVGSVLVAEVERARSADQAASNVAERIRILKHAGLPGISRREAAAAERGRDS